ncbi:MAG: HAD hydrolase family protein, partial [Plesiomonas shigelloides]
EQVLPLKGMTLADCIAFGDGMNDLEMLSMVGKGCVMQNAHQRLKDALPDAEVIGDNADEAVAHYLRRMFIA